jgi:hypothetical protein
VIVGPIAPVPQFILISLRTGPFTTTIAEEELDVDPRALTSEAASARMTGKYSGRAPAITAFTATLSTVYSQWPRNSVACMWPTTSSGLRLVAPSMAATRFSVGKTIGNARSSCFRETVAGDCPRYPARADAATNDQIAMLTRSARS